MLHPMSGTDSRRMRYPVTLDLIGLMLINANSDLIATDAKLKRMVNCLKKNTCSPILDLGTPTEQAFGTSHLSQLPLDPGSKSALVPGPTASRGSVGGQGPFVPVGATNRDKWREFGSG